MTAQEVNRSLLIVEAKQPFVDWLQSLEPEEEFTLEKINDDATAFLIPECEFDEEFERWLKKHFDAIFKEELHGWWTDASVRPQKRTFDLFRKWFHCRIHSVVLDLATHALEVF